MKSCCINWVNITSSIEVTARDFDNPSDIYKANCVEKLLKYLIGNYCPTCGNKLRKGKFIKIN